MWRSLAQAEEKFLRAQDADYKTHDHLIEDRECEYIDSAGRGGTWRVPKGPSFAPGYWSFHAPHGVDVNNAAKLLASTLHPVSQGQWHVGFRPTEGVQYGGSAPGSAGRFYFYVWHRGEGKSQRWDHPGGTDPQRVLSEYQIRMYRTRDPLSRAAPEGSSGGGRSREDRTWVR